MVLVILPVFLQLGGRFPREARSLELVLDGGPNLLTCQSRGAFIQQRRVLLHYSQQMNSFLLVELILLSVGFGQVARHSRRGKCIARTYIYIYVCVCVFANIWETDRTDRWYGSITINRRWLASAIWIVQSGTKRLSTRKGKIARSQDREKAFRDTQTVLAEVRSLLFRQNRSASDSPFFYRRVQSLVVLHVCFSACSPPARVKHRTFDLLQSPLFSSISTYSFTYLLTYLLSYSLAYFLRAS